MYVWRFLRVTFSWLQSYHAPEPRGEGWFSTLEPMCTLGKGLCSWAGRCLVGNGTIPCMATCSVHLCGENLPMIYTVVGVYDHHICLTELAFRDTGQTTSLSSSCALSVRVDRLEFCAAGGSWMYPSRGTLPVVPFPSGVG